MGIAESILVTELRDKRRALSDAEISDWEDEIGMKLPLDYREFLLIARGGEYYDHLGIVYDLTTDRESFEIGLFHFPSLEPNGTRELGLRWAYDMYQGRIPRDMIPIGAAANDILLIAPKEGGRVYYWQRDEELNVSSPEDNKLLVASTFEEFAMRCRLLTDEERAIHSYELIEPFRSIEFRRLEHLRAYLDQGGSLSALNERGRSLLHVACIHLNYEAAEELLRRGADPNTGSHVEGLPPLYSAAGGGARDIVELLLKYGASLYMDSTNTKTVLESLPWPPDESIRLLIKP